jgi:hypothetical protein
MNEITVRGKLVDAERLLVELFAEGSRPSLRWLRSLTKARAIPFVKIGHLVFFDVELVRQALANKNLVRGRSLGSAMQRAA